MQTLHNDLEKLRKLNEMRAKAFELRDSGYKSLRDIAKITPGENPKIDPDEQYRQWQAMGNVIEAATLLKIKRHWRLTRKGTGPSTDFEKKLDKVTLDALFAEEADRDSWSEQQSNELLDRRVPVLVAALCMELRSERSATALSLETILCYYRILVEMNLATWPDWMVGAARAGEGAMVTAFVTGECVRAIMAFQRALDNTAKFLRQTRYLYERHQVLVEMSASIGRPGKDHPLTRWSNFALHRIWLDWFIATEPERRAIALPLYDKGRLRKAPTISELEEWFRKLRVGLSSTTSQVYENFANAFGQIKKYGKTVEMTDKKSEHQAEALARKHAREFGRLVMKTAVDHARKLKKLAALPPSFQPDDLSDLPRILKELEAKFATFSKELGRILDVSKHYVEGVLDRALADPAKIDIGELAFAAAAYGSATDWQSKQRLKRVCEVLLQSIPPSGLPVTRIPFHSTRRGYKLLPTGCHIVGSLALLLTKTGYDFEPETVEPLLHAIDSRKIIIHGTTPPEGCVGWNFEGSARRNAPSVWVTSVTVLALDRLIRTFDARINAIVFDHFTVELPEHVRNRPSLNELVYPDYGLSTCAKGTGTSEPMAILLERLRAHLVGVRLPQAEAIPSSVILHGPPGTGKTTWAEALAKSSEAPLLRLSPFDLIATPRGPLENVTIQTRARQVFEALSMLTRAVILFDEFEPVFLEREAEDETGKRSKAGREEIPFLQTGLLPMLVRLHDVAGPQNLVYCLATNHVAELDRAVKRQGRFDLHLEVNHPDPLSRAGTFLYRMASVRRTLRKCVPQSPAMATFLATLDKETAIRLVELIKRTRGHPTSDLVTYFNLPGWATVWSDDQAAGYPAPDCVPESWEKDVASFASVLPGRRKPFQTMPKDEKRESDDLKKYEEALVRAEIGSAADAADVLKHLAFHN